MEMLFQLILLGAVVAGFAFLVSRLVDRKDQTPSDKSESVPSKPVVTEQKVVKKSKPKKKKTTKKKSVKKSKSVADELKQ